MEALDNYTELNLKPFIYAEKISSYHYSEAQKIASLWASVAQEKANLAIIPSEKSQFVACSNISSGIANYLSSPLYHRNIYVCKDQDGTSLGMMSLSINYDRVYIELLVTNPINIRSSVNDHEPNKVSGAGSTLLLQAEEIAIKEGKNFVYLTPLNTAVGFYKKNGYEFEGWQMRKQVQECDDEYSLAFG